jgi:hypothetical protein
MPKSEGVADHVRPTYVGRVRLHADALTIEDLSEKESQPYCHAILGLAQATHCSERLRI